MRFCLHLIFHVKMEKMGIKSLTKHMALLHKIKANKIAMHNALHLALHIPLAPHVQPLPQALVLPCSKSAKAMT